MDEYGVHGMSAEAVRDHVDNLLKGAIGHPTQGSGEGHYFMGRPSADHVCGETGVSEEDLADLGPHVRLGVHGAEDTHDLGHLMGAIEELADPISQELLFALIDPAEEPLGPHVGAVEQQGQRAVAAGEGYRLA